MQIRPVNRGTFRVFGSGSYRQREHVPLEGPVWYSKQRVNRKLTDQQIASTFEALRRTGVAVSGRSLRAALRQQFGAAGKTDRVFALCRALQAPGGDEISELRRRLEEAERGRAAAELARDQALERAVRAEAREMAHQDRWANEIYTLRQRVRQLQGEGERRLLFQPNVHRVGEAPAACADGIESVRVDSGRD
jgi:hypothetical protein